MSAGEMIDFKNGWSIRIHDVRDEQVLYQSWPPGVERQSFIDRLWRMSTADFESRVAEERKKEAA